ncbi:MAG: DUF1501 domain-containing protein [Planctomycetaceae bacterium]
MPNAFDKLDSVSRRTLLEVAAKSAFGLSVLAPRLAGGAPGSAGKSGQAKQVIYLFMNGAMSHLDTFDLKPGREVQGETTGIATSAAGVRIGNHLPQLAKMMKHVVAVRSLYQETAAHRQGRYLMRTSYAEIATTRHPFLGAWAQKLDGKRLQDLPDSVVVGNTSRHPGAGFMEPEFSPLPIGRASQGLKNTTSPEYLKDRAIKKRLNLASQFDASFQRKYRQKQVRAYNDFYEQATRLLASSELSAFDLKQEKQSVRDAYGDNPFGQGCLLARRLAENRVRFIEVTSGKWDHHRDLYKSLPEQAAILDQGLSALLADLQQTGMLQQTLVVLATEFGRSPKINQNGGRDHHPGAFSSLLAGGGVRGGRFYGSSDEDGHSADENRTSVADFNATIAHALGLPIDKEVHSAAGRPFKVANDGSPITEIF